jgi:hypothetical protein
MCVRPSPHNARRAALSGGPVSQQNRFNATESNAAAIELQAQQLRTRFSVAPPFWGPPR